MFELLQSNWDQVVDNFDDMELREELLRGIYAYGFEKPSAIQQRAIIPCIKGKRQIVNTFSSISLHMRCGCPKEPSHLDGSFECPN